MGYSWRDLLTVKSFIISLYRDKEAFKLLVRLCLDWNFNEQRFKDGTKILNYR